jgi:hypothetical protein
MLNGTISPNVPSAQPPSKVLSVYRPIIHKRLANLVSLGTADLYGDACKHMDTDPPFASQTHVVAHLLREVESSLRGVLRPLTSLTEKICDECHLPISGQQCACGRPKALISHQKQIEAILSVLGVTADDPLALAWDDIRRKHHKYAHRDSLERPRPVDTEFMEFWSQTEAVLNGTLDRFETRYADVLNRLDVFMKKPTPAKKDVKTFLSTFPNNQTTHQHFFDNIVDAAWLPLLKNEGVFKKVPSPVYSEDGTMYYPAWPPLAYLQRMTISHPEEVAKILLDIDETENEMVISSLLDIATKLPEAQRLPLMGKLIKWI